MAILDADKEGFLRAERSLIQILAGRLGTWMVWRCCMPIT